MTRPLISETIGPNTFRTGGQSFSEPEDCLCCRVINGRAVIIINAGAVLSAGIILDLAG